MERTYCNVNSTHRDPQGTESIRRKEQQDSGAAQDTAATGLYFHVPFCAAKCSYCDFYSRIGSEEHMAEYTDSIIGSIKNNPYTGRAVDTLYFGGGTPTVLPLSAMEQIIGAAKENFALLPQAEITVEANPDQISQEYMEGLAALGVTRMSFGVQSAVSRELRVLGRTHTAEEAEKVIRQASQYFPHISADLMLGIPYQSPKSLEESLEFILGLPVDHISAYMLMLEETVPLYSSSAMEHAADDEQLAQMYLQTAKTMEQNGFMQYEISNFAQKGGKSQHNLKYWKSHPYLGFGPSAHSFMDCQRFSFAPNLARFLSDKTGFDSVCADGTGGQLSEYLMLRLRLTQGVILSEAKEKYPRWNQQEFIEQAKRLEENTGLVTVTDDSVALTTEGFLLSNTLTAKLLRYIDDEEASPAK